MKRFLINTLKVIMLPVIVYLIFLVICFERFSNWNCIYTIFIQTIIPTIKHMPLLMVISVEYSISPLAHVWSSAVLSAVFLQPSMGLQE